MRQGLSGTLPPDQNRPRRGRRTLTVLLPIAFFLAGALTSLLLYWSIERAEKQRSFIEAQITAEQIRLRVEAWIDSRTALARHLGEGRYENVEQFNLLFGDEARSFVELYPGIQAFNFIDTDLVIRMVVPESGNAPALNRNLANHPSPGVVEAVTRAAETSVFTRSPIIDLLQGGKGFATYQRLVTADGTHLGFVNAVFRIDTLIDSCLAEESLRRRFRFTLTENGNTAYAHAAEDSAAVWPSEVRLPVRIVDRVWTLRLAPTLADLEITTTMADEVLAGLGLAFSAILALLLWSLLKRHRALARSRARYRLLVENQTDMVVKIDPQGRFVYVSPAYCRTFGKSEAELLGDGFLPLVHEDDRAATDRAMRDLYRPPHSCYVEQRTMTQQGWRWLSWSDTAVLDDQGRVTAIIGVGRDITERRELEEQLMQSQKMQAIGQLGGGIAHDFNNMLQSMRGYLELTLNELSDDDPHHDNLQQVNESIIKAASLTRQLLTFSRQEMLISEVLDVNAVISNHLRMLRRIIGEPVVLDFRPGEGPLLVNADRSQLEQVLLNLCVNARDAMDGSGVVLISTELCVLDADRSSRTANLRPGSYVSVAVADDGRGIAPEIKERIFEPFFTTKNEVSGIGLGLATVFGIVRQHEGDVFVDSEPDRGACFTVLLPLSDGTLVVDEVAAASTESDTGQETILIAEDNDQVRELAVTVLKRKGYRVLAAADGAECVRLYEEHRGEVALAILDVVMPVMNGPAAARQLRRLNPSLRLVFTSGYAPADSGDLDPELAGSLYLAKPYGVNDLLQKVRRSLD